MKCLLLFFASLFCLCSGYTQELYTNAQLSEPADSSRFDKEKWYWYKASVDSGTAFLRFTDWAYVEQVKGGRQKTGSMLPASEKTYFSWANIVPVDPGEELVFKLKGNHPLFELDEASVMPYSSDKWRMEERQRLIAHGVFFGILIVMALYNLMIYVAVKDQSYLWYVLAIVGFGLYMAFYYGFCYELLWPEWPVWNAYFFALIIPVTNVFRILFTKTYLHTRQMAPKWNLFFRIWMFMYAIPVVMWLISYLQVDNLLVETNYVIGFLGLVNMASITVVSVITYRRGYAPALWFLTAFVLFNFGAILFIFLELDYLADNFFTRYVVQIGAVAQVVLFSMGLSSRLNRTRRMLSMRTLEKEKLAREKEIEKKELIEQQRQELEIKVRSRTQELEKTLSQLKASESELRELNQIKSRLFSIISHDLKAPLATVDSFLNLLINHLNKLTADELADVSAKTQFALQNLTMLLDNLLLWSRLQQDRVTLNPQEIELYKVVDKALKLFVLLIEQKKLRVDVSTDIDDTILWADKDTTEFIVRNLIHNAVKFTPKGGQIKIDVEHHDQNALISVKDSGVGMSERMIHQILHTSEGFTREGTEQEKGSGIGLIICKDFIEKNGGNLFIETDEGTTISFEIPGRKDVGVMKSDIH